MKNKLGGLDGVVELEQKELVNITGGDVILNNLAVGIGILVGAWLTGLIIDWISG